jgi:hypothetical protein
MPRRLGQADLPRLVRLSGCVWHGRGWAGWHLSVTRPRLPLLLWQPLPWPLPSDGQRMSKFGMLFAVLLPLGPVKWDWEKNEFFKVNFFNCISLYFGLFYYALKNCPLKTLVPSGRCEHFEWASFCHAFC